MNSVIQCGNAWQCLGDLEAGHLLRHLRSTDVDVRNAAEQYLVQAGPPSIKLLRAALVS